MSFICWVVPGTSLKILGAGGVLLDVMQI